MYRLPELKLFLEILMASYLWKVQLIKEIFGDALYVPHEAERPPCQFASPEDLKHKIIISDSPPKDTLREQVCASSSKPRISTYILHLCFVVYMCLCLLVMRIL